MDYFLSHLLYIVIAGVVIAFLGFLTVILADKNEKHIGEIEHDSNQCGLGCENCTSFSGCSRPQKKDR